MSSVPTDNDEDDIKHILESIWEMTSGDENGRAKRPDRPRPIQLKREQSSADADTGIRGLDPLPPIRTSTEANSLVPGAKRTRLADRLETDTHNTLPETQLSSLTRPGDAHAMSASENNSQNGSRNLNGAPKNQNGIVLPNPYAQREAGSVQQSVAPDAALNSNSLNQPIMSGDRNASPANLQPSQQAASSGTAKSPEPNRVMVPFADSSMCKMANVSTSPTPRTVAQPPPATAAPAPAPAAPAPVVAKTPQTNVTTQQHIDAPAAPVAASHSTSSHDSAAEMMRPVLRQWLGENMPRIVETALQIEVAQSLKDHPDEPDKQE